jgi:hypothetical protein
MGQKFITVFTRAYRFSLPWAKLIKFMPSTLTCLRAILCCSICLGLTCSMFRALGRSIKFINRPTNTLEFMNIKLLHSDHRLISASHVVIFTVVRTSVEIIPKLRILQFLLKCSYFILTVLFYCSTVNFYQKNRVTFNRVVISTHYNCIYTLVLNTLKMATWVADARRWLLYNKITFVNPKAFVGLFNKFYI